MVGRAWVVGNRTSLALAWILPGVLVLVAVTGMVATHGFDGLYGQDAFGYVNYALGPLREALARGAGLPAFGQPPGFPTVIAAISFVVGPDARIGLGVSIVAGALVPVMTALVASEALGRRLGGGRAVIAVPLVAALVAALPGQLWQSSAVAMSDTLSVALATTGAWAACRYWRTGHGRWLALAAACVSGAVDTRWVYGLVAVPIATVGLIGVRMVWRTDAWRAIGHLGGAILIGAFVVAPVSLPMALALAGGTPVPFSADFGAYPWDPLNAFRTSFDSSDGRLIYGTTSGAFYLGQLVAPYWFGPPGLLAIWGAVWVARRGGVVATLLLVGWPSVVLAFLVGSPYQNTRFFLSLMPPVAILIAVALWRIARIADDRLPHVRRHLWTALIAVIASVWLIAAIVAAGRFTSAFIDRQAGDLAAIRGLEAQVPIGARLVAMGPTGVFVRDGLPDVIELFDLDPGAAADLLADGRPTYLVIDPAAMAGQWAGRGPALTVDAIRASHAVDPIAKAGAWTLYRVDPSP